MNNLKESSVERLAIRLNDIRLEKNKLDLEEISIIHELWERIPSLKEDTNLKVKTLQIEYPKGKLKEGN